jgi:LuxR family maltose regulon positive regulatory protein
VWQRGNVEALLEELIRSNVFITANAAGFYSFHHLFMSHVLAAFDALSEQKRASIWKRAGEYYLNAGETIPAMNCFMKTGDFAAMLTALVSRNGVDLTNTQREKVIACLDGCPDAVLGQNLSAVLVLARCMFSYKEMTRFGRCIAVFENNIGAFSGIESERNALMMNYERFLALSKFNSIEGMSYHHRRALDYKDDKYRTEEWSVNWTFGSPSILMLYHSKNGALAEELTQMRECMPIFVRLSEGVGSGSEFVMEAEAAFYAGDFAVAETIIHKAQYYAREKNQWSILLAAEFLRMRLSLVKGDWFETANIQQQVADMVNTQKLYLLQHTIDIIWSYIYLLLGIPDRVAGWITDGDFTKTRVMFPALPALYMVYNRHLLATGEYLKVCSGAAVALNISSYYPQPFGSIWAYIYLAAAYSKLGQRDEALSRLMTSLDIALPDNLLMPFVDNGEYIADLLSELAGNEQYADGIARIFALYKDFSQIRKKLMREHFSQNAGALTERELAVARMASEGLSNRAIGTRLFLSEDGVKSRLKSVFEKLGVTSRKQLANKLKP